MYKIIFPVLFLLTFMTPVCMGQGSNQNNRVNEKMGFALAAHASTNGIGAQVVYAINEKFSVRGGYEKLKFNINFEFDENDIDYDANFNFKTGSVSLLADYQIISQIYVTGGAAIHLMNSSFNGVAISDFQYGDISIPPEDIGDFNFRIKPNFRLSPYGGIGFGRNIGDEKDFAINFEIGAFYMGKPDVSIEATGLLSPTADPAHGQEELFEKQLKRYSVYPVIKLGVSYVIF